MQNYKVLFGIKALSRAIIDGLEENAYEDDWYDFELHQCDGWYGIIFETMIGFNESGDCKKYIREIFDELTVWMNNHNFNTEKVLNMYQVFAEGLNVNSKFESIEDCYAMFKLFVNGFEGDGLSAV